MFAIEKDIGISGDASTMEVEDLGLAAQSAVLGDACGGSGLGAAGLFSTLLFHDDPELEALNIDAVADPIMRAGVDSTRFGTAGADDALSMERSAFLAAAHEPCGVATPNVGCALSQAPTELLAAHLALREATAEAHYLLREVRARGASEVVALGRRAGLVAALSTPVRAS
eukprot:NODE_12917_length_1196_cov_6.430309.p1 GENE.NODE_12917_length_1196_cov_6.430309~~NODE_12917_length_1196_cov_6.430309.p1  ORF type:complete len:171 (+),score=49.74 NODE_12917_length_1196_cov_6.430309:526-1038(+)